MNRASFCLATALSVVGMTSASFGTVVLTDDFESYADTAAVQAAWTTAENGLALNNTGFDPTPTPLATIPHATTTNLGRFNGSNFAYRSFTPSDAGVSWRVSADVIMEGYSRSLAIGLTDANGVGYLARWNGANSNQFSGRGMALAYQSNDSIVSGGDYGVQMTNLNRLRLDGDSGYPATPITDTTASYDISTTPNSYHANTGYRITATSVGDQNLETYSSEWYGMVTWTLDYNADTNTLSLFTGGASDNPNDANAVWYKVLDTPLENIQFSRVYLMGQNANFDNVVVEIDAIPEPATLGLLALGGLMVAGRRRRA